MSLPEPWPDFAIDPRRPENASVRAADADRDVVASVLTEAYAHGRLDRDEYDERSAKSQQLRTLGEVPALIEDLVAPTSSTELLAPSPAVPAAVEAQAVQRWESNRREALLGWMIPTLITWVVWSVTMFGEFPWPAIVTAATAVPLLKVIVGKEDIIDGHRRKILRKQAKRGPAEIEGNAEE